MLRPAAFVLAQCELVSKEFRVAFSNSSLNLVCHQRQRQRHHHHHHHNHHDQRRHHHHHHHHHHRLHFCFTFPKAPQNLPLSFPLEVLRPALGCETNALHCCCMFSKGNEAKATLCIKELHLPIIATSEWRADTITLHSQKKPWVPSRCHPSHPKHTPDPSTRTPSK